MPRRLPAPPLPPARRPDRGQSLVEFALMLIFLTVLLMGVLDLARAYFTYLAIKDAAAEGAYFGSAFPQCIDAGSATANPGCAGANNIDYRTRNSAPQGGLVDWSDTATTLVTVGHPPTLLDGASITVTVRTRYQLITPLVSAIVPGQTITLSASSSAVIIRVMDCTFSPCQ